MVEVSIVVPAHNEEGNLPQLVTHLRDLAGKVGDAEIILVDDHSTDQTPRLVDEYQRTYPNVRAIHRRNGIRGMGNTLKEGTATARGKFVIWTMADLSDDWGSVPPMLDKLRNGADMVFASRYMPGGSSGDLESFKRFVSSGFTFASRLFIGVPVHDITNAYRGFRREVYDKIRPEAGDFAISPEFALKAQLAGYKLDEVPTTYAKRQKGVANFRIFKMARRYFGMFVKANLTWRFQMSGLAQKAS
jgi:glycosyltransferase involved in cell wall biosynthesis